LGFFVKLAHVITSPVIAAVTMTVFDMYQIRISEKGHFSNPTNAPKRGSLLSSMKAQEEISVLSQASLAVAYVGASLAVACL
jgi:hypothetical protein